MPLLPTYLYLCSYPSYVCSIVPYLCVSIVRCHSLLPLLPIVPPSTYICLFFSSSPIPPWCSFVRRSFSQPRAAPKCPQIPPAGSRPRGGFFPAPNCVKKVHLNHSLVRPTFPRRDFRPFPRRSFPRRSFRGGFSCGAVSVAGFPPPEAAFSSLGGVLFLPGGVLFPLPRPTFLFPYVSSAPVGSGIPGKFPPGALF